MKRYLLLAILFAGCEMDAVDDSNGDVDMLELQLTADAGGPTPPPPPPPPAGTCKTCSVSCTFDCKVACYFPGFPAYLGGLDGMMTGGGGSGVDKNSCGASAQQNCAANAKAACAQIGFGWNCVQNVLNLKYQPPVCY